jgi:hypothetical protein
MKLTNDWFKKQSACADGYEWVLKRGYDDAKKTVEELIKIGKLDWANWTIARALDRKGKIRYAIFAAEQVIDIYEKKYPDDKRPRKAIEAAKKVLKDDTEGNRNAAYAAANAAANAAAYAAANAADAAANAADAAANAAYAAAYAAYAAARNKMKEKIIRYGITLL